MKREKFSSRLGFILVSAGCAIGIGNVWKFPYMCGEYGGAAFILIYLLFLLIMGIPAMVCEFSIGRGSKKSVAMAFEQLEPAGTSWHLMKYIGIFGCYLYRDCDCRDYRADHASGRSIPADYTSSGKDQCVISGRERINCVAGGSYSD